jgi:glycosyltransferase involved in cell wall biosynthesis
VIVQDADLEYDPKDYPSLLAPIQAGQADVVYGTRFHGGGAHRVLFFWHYMGNLALTLISNMLTNLNLSDMEVGYKVFRAEAVKGINLKSNRFGFEPEITVKLAKKHCRFYEVPISYHGRTYEEGKKITWKDGVAALYYLIRFRLAD